MGSWSVMDRKAMSIAWFPGRVGMRGGVRGRLTAGPDGGLLWSKFAGRRRLMGRLKGPSMRDG